MKHNVVDTAYFVETPEGIDLEAQLAGPVPRVLAYTIDVTIRALILSVLSGILFVFDRMGVGIFLLISFLFEWFYPVFFEIYRQGQTPGKRRLNIVVVNDDLTPVTLDASMTRNLLRAADFLPFAYLLGLLSICMGKYFQRLGDIAAGTIVIHQSPEQKAVKLPECEPVMAPVVLELEDQAALINFTQRHDQLTTARQQELADILKDITKQDPKDAVSYLQGIGAWLLGTR